VKPFAFKCRRGNGDRRAPAPASLLVLAVYTGLNRDGLGLSTTTYSSCCLGAAWPNAAIRPNAARLLLIALDLSSCHCLKGLHCLHANHTPVFKSGNNRYSRRDISQFKSGCCTCGFQPLPNVTPKSPQFCALVRSARKMFCGASKGPPRYSVRCSGETPSKKLCGPRGSDTPVISVTAISQRDHMTSRSARVGAIREWPARRTDRSISAPTCASPQCPVSRRDYMVRRNGSAAMLSVST